MYGQAMSGPEVSQALELICPTPALLLMFPPCYISSLSSRISSTAGVSACLFSRWPLHRQETGSGMFCPSCICLSRRALTATVLKAPAWGSTRSSQRHLDLVA